MDEIVLNYETEGKGPPLLLVHGFGISFNIWKNLVPFLHSHFTLVMVELPGIGRSPMTGDGQPYLAACIEAIERLRLALGMETWDVLGYSTGSRIAEAYVRTYAPHVCRAVFLCPLALDSLKSMGLHFGLWVDGFLPAVGNWLLSGWRLHFLISSLAFNLRPDPHAEEWFNEIVALPVRVLKETLKVVDWNGTRPFEVPVSSVMIWGDIDAIPVRPRRRGPRDYFVHANHAAPVVAAGEVAGTILSILNQELLN
jgi:pimeloyl-ACP methyl ester carboxylesterase